jgi:hypothetical protein
MLGRSVGGYKLLRHVARLAELRPFGRYPFTHVRRIEGHVGEVGQADEDCLDRFANGLLDPVRNQLVGDFGGGPKYKVADLGQPTWSLMFPFVNIPSCLGKVVVAHKQ